MEGVWRGCGGGVEGVLRGCGGGLEGVWRGCGGGVEGVLRGCGGGVKGVWRGCGEGVEGFWFLVSGWPARGDGKAEGGPPENCSPQPSTERFTRSRQGGPKRAARDSTARATGGCQRP